MIGRRDLWCFQAPEVDAVPGRLTLLTPRVSCPAEH